MCCCHLLCQMATPSKSSHTLIAHGYTQLRCSRVKCNRLLSVILTHTGNANNTEIVMLKLIETRGEYNLNKNNGHETRPDPVSREISPKNLSSTDLDAGESPRLKKPQKHRTWTDNMSRTNLQKNQMNSATSVGCDLE